MELTADNSWGSVTNEDAPGRVVFTTDRVERLLYAQVASTPRYRWSAFDPAAPSVRRLYLE